MLARTILISLIITSLLAIIVLAGCNGDDSESSSQTPDENGNTTQPTTKEDVVITIGNLTDQTGVASGPMSYITMAFEDAVRYYNDNNLIPGVKIEIINYDDQYDPAKDIPGYEKLKRDGAAFIHTPVPSAGPVLKPRADNDKYVIITFTNNIREEEFNGGYVFSIGIMPEYEAYTLLDWIANNDEDFPTDRPAKIGGAAWNDGYSNLLFSAAEDYARVHSDEYEWTHTFLTDFGFDWTSQAELLKDCDYVFVPTPPQIFMRDYRNAGGTGKFIGTDVPVAFLYMIGKSGLWEEVDGSLFIRSSRWYNETGEFIDLTNRFLEENYSPAKAQDIKSQGCGYISVKHYLLMLDIVKKAVEEAGAENFDSEALYNAAIAWSYQYDDIPNFSNFTETKRISQNYYAVYEIDAGQQDIFRAHDEWIPQITSP